jgi:hypothetical protein
MDRFQGCLLIAFTQTIASRRVEIKSLGDLNDARKAFTAEIEATGKPAVVFVSQVPGDPARKLRHFDRETQGYQSVNLDNLIEAAA